MKPTHYTIQAPFITWSKCMVYNFHYSFSDLRKFLTDGHDGGGNGFLITRWDGTYKRLRGFGTIENPTTTLTTFNMVHYSDFDGFEINPDEIVNPTPKPSILSGFSILIPKGRIL